MSNSIKNNNNCTGCGACISKCPVSAITLKQEIQGMYRAVVNTEKCTSCGLCTSICPVMNPKYQNSTNPKCYAFDTNEELNLTSATAGGFQILAKHFIKIGGKVVGAAWVSDEHGNYTSVKHIMVDNLEDLKSLYKSKYLQSNMGNIYEQVEQELEQGTKVLFSGVSCQVAGLYSMLNKKYDNLYTIDLVCYHAPSQGYFKKYLDEQFGKDNVKEFDFRAKDKNNIYSLNYKVKLKDGKEIIKSHWDDLFCKLFLERYIMAESCENCRFAKYPKQGDITLGDFHRIEETDPEFLDFRTEAVLVNNLKGEKLLEILKQQTTNLKEKDLELLSKGNKVCENWPAHPKRDLFKKLVANNMPISKAANIVINNYYDIGLVGMPGNNNYGGALTYYALYNVLKDLGKSILFIQQPEDSYWKPSNTMTAFKNNPYYEYEIAKIYPNRDALSELNQYCDMFMVGSDQLFATDGLYEYCNKFTSLDWVESRKKKVAYAASFGRDNISCDDYNRALLGYYLNRFDKFTVREISAVDLCKREFNLNTEVVLDPVFLCDQIHYYNLINNGNYQDNQKLGIYVLDNNGLAKEIIEDSKTRLNIETIKIEDAYKETDYNNIKQNIPKVEDWLSLIAGSKFFITDSFHGICFAILFKKPFIAICNKQRGAARFESLVKLLGLEKHLIYNIEDYNNNRAQLENIDWEDVYFKLNLLRKNSMAILENMISISQNKKIATDYDLFHSNLVNLNYNQYLLNTKSEDLEQKIKNTQEQLLKCEQDIKINLRNDFLKLIDAKENKQVYLHEKDSFLDVKTEEISVVVQGAINREITPIGLKSIRDFLPDAEIILSTWEGTDVEDLDFDILILNKDPGSIKTDLVNNVNNNQNRQLVSTREGINVASRKYILKLRTDFVLHSAKFLEYWNKFPVRDEKYNIFRHKIITSSVFSREYSDYNHRPILFHPSDFFLFGLANDLKDYFKNIRLATDEELGNWQYLYPNKIPYPEAHYRYAPEQFFLLSYVKQFFPDIDFEDWSDWNETNQKISKNIMYNNFIFLDYKQSEIYSKKFAYLLENPDSIYGLITYRNYQEVYKDNFDSKYIFENEIVDLTEEIEELPLIPKGFEEYKILNFKFKKHLYYFIYPFRRIITWIWQPIPILYNLVKLSCNRYFVRRLLSCFIFDKQKRRKFRGNK